jgi:glycosyltransferase involved in cell wall biosynthesis
MSRLPLISVVIATFNRSDVLKVTLEKLASQSLSASDFEVLVVDDGSSDDTSLIVEPMISSAPYPLRYFRHENRGPGYAENRGIRQAKSSLVLLMADDIWASPELLEQHLQAHAEYPQENIAVLGKVVQSPKLPQSNVQKCWDPFRYDRFNGKEFVDNIYFFACNISVKKNFLLQNGMFKEIKAAAHEDVELGYRLGQKGLKIYYEPSALGYHYHIESLSKACSRAYERGRNFNILTENIPGSIVFPAYKIFSFKAGPKAFLRMLPREIVRRCLFNKLSVKYFLLPVLQRADTNRLAALFGNDLTYRGTVYYHVRKGLRYAKKEKKKEQTKRN